jgi:GTPase Era involved in 16S rRNA processing
MVIGIVGPQSSGKSTLLNFVLGCDFMSSLGRCTKGVYGTYYEITNKEEANFDSILVLDTEGLMSNYENPHYANRNNFDLKLLLFCMKICDIVIFNNRGEFTR